MRQLPPLAAAAAVAAAAAASSAAAPDTAAVCMSKLLLLRTAAAAADAGRNSEIIALSGGLSGHNSWVPGSSRANYGRSLSPLGPHHYSNQPQRLHIIGIGNDVFLYCAFHNADNIQRSEMVWTQMCAPVKVKVSAFPQEFQLIPSKLCFGQC